MATANFRGVEASVGSVDGQTGSVVLSGTYQTISQTFIAAADNADIVDRFDTGKTNGPINGQKTLTGQTYTSTGVVVSNVTSNGVLVDADNTSGNGRAGYNSVSAGRSITFMSADVAFTAGTVANTFTMIAWAAEPGAYLSANGKAPAASCHFILGVGTWTYAVFDSSGNYAVINQGTYSSYPQDGVTFRRVSIAIDPNLQTAWVLLPDGSTVTLTDSRISASCPWFCLEPYYVDATAGRKPIVKAVIGDGGGSRLQNWTTVRNTAQNSINNTNNASNVSLLNVLKRTKPILLATSTSATALTRDSIQPFNSNTALTNTLLPSLSSAAIGDTYWLKNLSFNKLTQPLATNDLTADGLTSISLSYPGTIEIVAVADPASSSGGKVWSVINHVRSDSNLATIISNAIALGVSQATNSPVDLWWDTTLNSGSGGYPSRTSVTSNIKQRVNWIGPQAPTSGGTGAISGIDTYLATV